MKNKSLLWILVSIFLLVGGVNAVQDFALSTNTLSSSINTSSSSSSTFTIENTGNESINLTLDLSALSNGSDTLTASLDSTIISDLANGSTVEVTLSYDSADVSGNFTGTILVYNTQNSSLNETIDVRVLVNEVVDDGADDSGSNTAQLSFVDSDGDSINELGFNVDVDDREIQRLFLENTGDINFTNLRLSIDESEGGISTNDFTIEIDNVETDEIVELAVGETSAEIEIIFDSDNVNPGTYEDIELVVETDGGHTFTIDIGVLVSGDDEIIIQDSSLNVFSGLMTIVGESGKRVRGYEFEIENIGDFDVNDISFELDGDLKEEFTANTISRDAVSFSPSSVDLRDGGDDEIEVIVEIPKGQSSGNYFANIRAVSQGGKVYDDIRLKVRVIGDIYIREINFDESVSPGDRVEVEVVVKNQGSQTYRNVKVSGTLFDIDFGNSDIHESLSSFILNVGDEKTKTLVFNIPEDASDGSHTFELRLTYDDEEVVEVNELIVNRPVYNIVVEGSAINPPVIECSGTIYSYMKIRNLGKYDEDIRVVSVIRGTIIKDDTNLFEIGVDDIIQKNLVLNVEDVPAGEYTVENKVYYSGNLFKKEEHELRVDPCADSGEGVIVNPINDSDLNETAGDNELFGMDRDTAYLASALGAVVLLIIVSLFFI